MTQPLPIPYRTKYEDLKHRIRVLCKNKNLSSDDKVNHIYEQTLKG